MERGECFVYIPHQSELMLSWKRKFEPVMTVYESKPNLADHDKIQGMNANWSAPSS